MHFQGITDAVLHVEQHRMAVWESTRVRFDMRVVEESIDRGVDVGRVRSSSRIVGGSFKRRRNRNRLGFGQK